MNYFEFYLKKTISDIKKIDHNSTYFTSEL